MPFEKVTDFMSIPYFDTHCDTASVIMEGFGLRSNSLHIDLERGGKYTPWAQFFAFFADEGNFGDYKAQYENFTKETRQNSDKIMLCKEYSDAEKAFKDGKSAAFLMIEGAELLDCSVDRLKEAREDGVRIVTITWNHANLLSGSNVDRIEDGLSDRGRDFVRACNELGVVPDVSHLSDPGFWDIIELTEKPIIATHSNSRKIWNHTRNLTDDMFRALIQTGGIVGINLYGEFIGEDPDIQGLIRHVDHFLNLGGEGHLAIGADLDGCDVLPREITGIQDMPVFYDALEKEFGEKIARGIFFDNAASFFRKI